MGRTGILLLVVAAAAANDKPRWSDDAIRKLAYDVKYRYPQGFSTDPATQPGAALYWHDDTWLTDDAAAARRMVEAELKQSAVEDKTIQAVRKTARGFDFRAGFIWYRVHRPSYFEWAKNFVAFDVSLDAKGTPRTLGRLNARPLTAEAARELAEYDYRIRHFNGSGAKVLASDGRETKTHYVRVLETIMVTGGDFGMADEIRRFRLTYAVEKSTGKTTKARLLVRTIKGRRN